MQAQLFKVHLLFRSSHNTVIEEIYVFASSDDSSSVFNSAMLMGYAIYLPPTGMLPGYQQEVECGKSSSDVTLKQWDEMQSEN